jgi:hypothetical protein
MGKEETSRKNLDVTIKHEAWSFKMRKNCERYANIDSDDSRVFL